MTNQQDLLCTKGNSLVAQERYIYSAVQTAYIFKYFVCLKCLIDKVMNFECFV